MIPGNGIPWGSIGDWDIYFDDFSEEGDVESWEDSWDNREHMWTDKEGFKGPKDHAEELAKALEIWDPMEKKMTGSGC